MFFTLSDNIQTSACCQGDSLKLIANVGGLVFLGRPWREKEPLENITAGGASEALLLIVCLLNLTQVGIMDDVRK